MTVRWRVRVDHRKRGRVPIDGDVDDKRSSRGASIRVHEQLVLRHHHASHRASTRIHIELLGCRRTPRGLVCASLRTSHLALLHPTTLVLHLLTRTHSEATLTLPVHPTTLVLHLLTRAYTKPTLTLSVHRSRSVSRVARLAVRHVARNHHRLVGARDHTRSRGGIRPRARVLEGVVVLSVLRIVAGRQTRCRDASRVRHLHGGEGSKLRTRHGATRHRNTTNPLARTLPACLRIQHHLQVVCLDGLLHHLAARRRVLRAHRNHEGSGLRCLTLRLRRLRSRLRRLERVHRGNDERRGVVVELLKRIQVVSCGDRHLTRRVVARALLDAVVEDVQHGHLDVLGDVQLLAVLDARHEIVDPLLVRRQVCVRLIVIGYGVLLHSVQSDRCWSGRECPTLRPLL